MGIEDYDFVPQKKKKFKGKYKKDFRRRGRSVIRLKEGTVQ